MGEGTLAAWGLRKQAVISLRAPKDPITLTFRAYNGRCRTWSLLLWRAMLDAPCAPEPDCK